MAVMGIDPGLSGALALIDDDGDLWGIFNMPVVEAVRNGKAKREINPVALADIFHSHSVDCCYIERVGAMPGQGTSSTFAFGRATGIVIGIAAAVDVIFHEVAPATWRGACRLPAGSGKAVSRQKAAALFPVWAHWFERAKDDGRAEAALIAWYGLQAEKSRQR